MRILTNRLIIYAEFVVVGGPHFEIKRFFKIYHNCTFSLKVTTVQDGTTSLKTHTKQLIDADRCKGNP